jgi:hypothetical protein
MKNVATTSVMTPRKSLKATERIRVTHTLTLDGMTHRMMPSSHRGKPKSTNRAEGSSMKEATRQITVREIKDITNRRTLGTPVEEIAAVVGGKGSHTSRRAKTDH